MAQTMVADQSPQFLAFIFATRTGTCLLMIPNWQWPVVGKWMVPFDVEKLLSSRLNSSITEAVGNKLQWSENQANHRAPLWT